MQRRALGRSLLAWMWPLLVASLAIACLAWWQSSAMVAFDVRAERPVALQIFYSADGAFSEADSLHLVAVPSTGGQVRVRVPADRIAYLRVDPAGTTPRFDICGLRTRGDGDRYRPASANQLSWATRTDCLRLAPADAADDPYLVLVDPLAGNPDGRARQWRWAGGIALVVSLLLAGLLAYSLDRTGTALGARADRVFHALTASAHWLVLALMVTMGSLIAHALPPNGIPDEIAHVSKVAKVNAGVLFEDSGTVPVVDVHGMYADLKDVREPTVIDPGALSTALARPLACHRAVRTLPTMADGYAPHLYAGSALVMSASCAAGTSFGTFLVLSRIVNLILAAGLIAIGVRFAGFGKWSLVAVALLPMTLAQVASVSADSLTIALSICFLGLVSGIASGRLATARVRYWLPVLALMLAFAKPGAAWILVAILFCRHAYPAGARAFPMAVLSTLVVPWVVHAGWVLSASSGAVPFEGVDPRANLALLTSDPLQVARLGYSTFFGPHGEFIYKSTIGLLGWLDVPLSSWAYALGGIALLGSLWTNDPNPGIRLRFRLVATIAAAGSLGLLSLPLYLYWTHPTSGIVMGLQGRYFLPTLAFFLVWMALRARPLARLLLLASVLSLPLLTLDAVRQINDRYYLVGR